MYCSSRRPRRRLLQSEQRRSLSRRSVLELAKGCEEGAQASHQPSGNRCRRSFLPHLYCLQQTKDKRRSGPRESNPFLLGVNQPSYRMNEAKTILSRIAISSSSARASYPMRSGTALRMPYEKPGKAIGRITGPRKLRFYEYLGRGAI